jgi:hypothetical protein
MYFTKAETNATKSIVLGFARRNCTSVTVAQNDQPSTSGSSSAANSTQVQQQMKEASTSMR